MKPNEAETDLLTEIIDAIGYFSPLQGAEEIILRVLPNPTLRRRILEVMDSGTKKGWFA